MQDVAECKEIICFGHPGASLIITDRADSDTKLEELTREVRAHNNFAQRVPVLEEQMKVANHRIADLEANEHTRERN